MSAHASLPEDEKEKIKSLLFIMNKFSVSLQAYHEISQLLKDAPRKHYIDSCQKTLDEQWLNRLKHMPGCVPGAELPFQDLLANAIQIHVCIRVFCNSKIIMAYGRELDFHAIVGTFLFSYS